MNKGNKATVAHKQLTTEYNQLLLVDLMSFFVVAVLFGPTAESGHCDNCIYKYCTHQLQNQWDHLKRKIKHINYCNALICQLPLLSAPE